MPKSSTFLVNYINGNRDLSDMVNHRSKTFARRRTNNDPVRYQQRVPPVVPVDARIVEARRKIAELQQNVRDLESNASQGGTQAQAVALVNATNTSSADLVACQSSLSTALNDKSINVQKVAEIQSLYDTSQAALQAAESATRAKSAELLSKQANFQSDQASWLLTQRSLTDAKDALQARLDQEQASTGQRIASIVSERDSALRKFEEKKDELATFQTSINGQNSALRSTIELQSRQIADLTQQKTDLENSVQEQRVTATNSAAEVLQQRTTIAALELSKSNLVERISVLTNEQDASQSQLNSFGAGASSQYGEIQQSLATAGQKVDELTVDLQSVTEARDHLMREKARLEEEITLHSATITEQIGQIRGLTEAKSQCVAALAEAEQKHPEEVSSLQIQLEAIKAIKNQLSDKVQSNQAQYETLQNQFEEEKRQSATLIEVHQAEVANLQQEKNDLEAAKELSEAKLAENVVQIERESRAAIAASKDQLNSNHQAVVESLQEEVATTLSTAEETKVRFEAAAQRHESRINELNHKVEEFATKSEVLTRTHTTALEEQKTKIDEYKQKIDTLSSEIESKNQAFASLQNELDSQKSVNGVTQIELEKSKRTVRDLNTEVASLQSKVEKGKEQVQEANHFTQECDEKLASLQQRKDEEHTRLLQLQDKHQTCTADLAQSQEELSANQEQLNVLETSYTASSAELSQCKENLQQSQQSFIEHRRRLGAVNEQLLSSKQQIENISDQTAVCQLKRSEALEQCKKTTSTLSEKIELLETQAKKVSWTKVWQLLQYTEKTKMFSPALSDDDAKRQQKPVTTLPAHLLMRWIEHTRGDRERKFSVDELIEYNGVQFVNSTTEQKTRGPEFSPEERRQWQNGIQRVAEMMDDLLTLSELWPSSLSFDGHGDVKGVVDSVLSESYRFGITNNSDHQPDVSIVKLNPHVVTVNRLLLAASLQSVDDQTLSSTYLHIFCRRQYLGNNSPQSISYSDAITSMLGQLSWITQDWLQISELIIQNRTAIDVMSRPLTTNDSKRLASQFANSIIHQQVVPGDYGTIRTTLYARLIMSDYACNNIAGYSSGFAPDILESLLGQEIYNALAVFNKCFRNSNVQNRDKLKAIFDWLLEIPALHLKPPPTGLEVIDKYYLTKRELHALQHIHPLDDNVFGLQFNQDNLIELQDKLLTVNIDMYGDNATNKPQLGTIVMTDQCDNNDDCDRIRIRQYFLRNNKPRKLTRDIIWEAVNNPMEEHAKIFDRVFIIISLSTQFMKKLNEDINKYNKELEFNWAIRNLKSLSTKNVGTTWTPQYIYKNAKKYISIFMDYKGRGFGRSLMASAKSIAKTDSDAKHDHQWHFSVMQYEKIQEYIKTHIDMIPAGIVRDEGKQPESLYIPDIMRTIAMLFFSNIIFLITIGHVLEKANIKMYHSAMIMIKWYAPRYFPAGLEAISFPEGVPTMLDLIAGLFQHQSNSTYNVIPTNDTTNFFPGKADKILHDWLQLDRDADWFKILKAQPDGLENPDQLMKLLATDIATIMETFPPQSVAEEKRDEEGPLTKERIGVYSNAAILAKYIRDR